MKAITNEIKAKIALMYFESTKVEMNFQNVEFNYISLLSSTQLEAIKYGYQLNENDINLKITSFNIQLKSLVNICDSDAIEISDILGNCSHLSYESKIQQIKELFISPNFYNKQTNIPANSWINVFQYLQFTGYALPYLNYSVEDLIKLNIYKIVE